MTIAFDPAVAASLAASDTSDNPLILWDNVATELSATLSTAFGTEVESAALTATGSTYDPWVVTPNNGFAILRLALTSAQSINSVAFAAHNLSKFVDTVAVRVEYSTDGGTTWLDSGAGPLTPNDNGASVFYFAARTAADWRLRLANAVLPGIPVDPSDANASIATVFWGTILTMPQRLYQGYTPPVVPSNVALQPNISDTGHFLGDAVIRRGSSADPTISHLTSSFVRSADFKGFMNHFNSGDNFFWAWRPTTFPDEVFYAKRARDTMRPQNTGPRDYMSVEMNMRFYDDP